jgi:cytochrome c-type biogenesis protein CcmE
MKRQNLKRRRIIFVTSSFLISLVALVFIVINFRDNIVFFYSPSELKTLKISADKTIRVGGLVKKNSVKYLADSAMEFTITDLKEDLVINYRGIKPDLFREGQGTVAKGVFDKEKNIFFAKELLTKHDEKYMPPEVARSLKKEGD